MAEKLELEIEKMLEMEVEHLKKSGVPSSSAFFFSPKGMFVKDPFDFRDKLKSKKLLKKIAKKHKATMVITIMSALISKLKDEIAGRPYFRKEVIFAYGETKAKCFGICQEFECNKNGQIVLGDSIIFPDGTGSMTGFLCRSYS
jgi:hypothetical protein